MSSPLETIPWWSQTAGMPARAKLSWSERKKNPSSAFLSGMYRRPRASAACRQTSSRSECAAPMAKTSSVSPQTLVISRLMSARTAESGKRQMAGEIVRPEQACSSAVTRREDEVDLEGLGPLGVVRGQGQHGRRGRAVVHGAVEDLVPGKSLVPSQMVVVGGDDDVAVLGVLRFFPRTRPATFGRGRSGTRVLADLRLQPQGDGREVGVLGPGQGAPPGPA